MPRPKLQTREERLEKRRLYERRRKERIKSNDVTREEFLRKDRERYARKKEAGLIVPRHEMTPRKLKNLRKKNKLSAAACYLRKKNRAASASTVAQPEFNETTGNQSEDDNTSNNSGPIAFRRNTPLTSRTTRCNSSRLISNNSISTNIQLDHTSDRVYSSSPRQNRLLTHQFCSDNNSHNPGPSTFWQVISSSSLIPTHHSVVRRCLQMNSDTSQGSDIQHDVDEYVQTSIHCEEPQNITYLTTGAPQITIPPNLSSIESTLCPNSPVSESSITSLEFKRGLKEKFRKYQRTKSKLITELQNKLLQVSKEKEMFKKRCFRVKNHYINSKKNIQKVEKSVKVKPKRKKNIQPKVVNFFEEDENSTVCPGKNNVISRHGLRKQKRLLTDTVKNLHLKYLESGSPPISYSTFSRMKPFWVIQPNVNARNTCLREKHENMKLLIESTKRNRLIKENKISDVLGTQLSNFVDNKNIQLRPIQLTEKLVLLPKISKAKKITKHLQPKKDTDGPNRKSIRINNISVIKPSTSQCPIGMSYEKERIEQQPSMIHRPLLEKYGDFTELSTPSCSFFENSDTAFIDKYEKSSNTDIEEEIKIKIKQKKGQILTINQKPIKVEVVPETDKAHSSNASGGGLPEPVSIEQNRDLDAYEKFALSIAKKIKSVHKIASRIQLMNAVIDLVDDFCAKNAHDVVEPEQKALYMVNGMVVKQAAQPPTMLAVHAAQPLLQPMTSQVVLTTPMFQQVTQPPIQVIANQPDHVQQMSIDPKPCTSLPKQVTRTKKPAAKKRKVTESTKAITRTEENYIEVPIENVMPTEFVSLRAGLEDNDGVVNPQFELLEIKEEKIQDDERSSPSPSTSTRQHPAQTLTPGITFVNDPIPIKVEVVDESEDFH